MPDESNIPELIKTGTAYAVSLGDRDLKSHIIVGASDKFVPNINAGKWNDEAWLNINYAAMAVTDEKEVLTDEKLCLTVGGVSFEAWAIDDKSLDIRLIFASAQDIPGDKKLRFKIKDSGNLEYHYQPELTQDELDNGDTRQDNVIGSYAVYLNKCNNEYKTGKLCHLYRWEASDAKGKKVWCGPLDIENGELIIPIPDVSGLVFPISFKGAGDNTTVGYTSEPSSSRLVPNHDLYAFGVFGTPGDNGTLTAIGAWINDYGNTFQLGLYDDNSGNPNNLIGETGEITAAIGKRQASQSASGSIVGGTTYHVGVQGAGNIYIYYDAGSEAYKWEATWSYDSGGMPDPFGSVDYTAGSKKNGVWFEYSASGATALSFDDTASATEIGDVALSLIRSFSFNDVSAASEISASVLTAIRGLGLSDAASSTAVTDAALAAVRKINISDIQSPTGIVQAAIDRIRGLGISDLSVETEAASAALDLIRALTLSDVSAPSEITSAALSAIRQVLIDDVSAATDITDCAVSAGITLGITDVASQSQVASVVLNAVRALAVTDVSVAAQVLDAAMAVSGEMTVADLSSETTVTGLLLTRCRAIGIDDISVISQVAGIIATAVRRPASVDVATASQISSVALTAIRGLSSSAVSLATEITNVLMTAIRRLSAIDAASDAEITHVVLTALRPLGFSDISASTAVTQLVLTVVSEASFLLSDVAAISQVSGVSLINVGPFLLPSRLFVVPGENRFVVIPYENRFAGVS